VSPATTARRSSSQRNEVVVLPSLEHLGSEGQALAGRVQVLLEPVPLDEPPEVGTDPAGDLLGRDVELLHQVLALVGRRREHRRAEPFHEALRVALVPRRRQYDHRLALGRELLELRRNGQRVEEQQALAVVERIRGDALGPPILGRPVRMRSFPVPQAWSQLAHGAMVQGAWFEDDEFASGPESQL
jgi:hypothetical protein